MAYADNPPSAFPIDADCNSSTGRQYIILPFAWSRITVNYTVYYVSPSGRVLLSDQEVFAYLTSEQTCKCYLHLSWSYDQVFNFDPFVCSLQPMQADCNSTCESWINCRPPENTHNWLTNIRRHLVNQEVTDFNVAKEARRAGGIPGKQTEDLSLDLKEHLVISTGETFYRAMTLAHYRHLAFEMNLSAVDMAANDGEAFPTDGEVIRNMGRISNIPAEIADQMMLLFLKQQPDGELMAISLHTNGTASVVDQVLVS